MKFITLIISLISFGVYAQESSGPSEKYRYGRPNPEAPEQIRDFEAMIGHCDCSSTKRKPDGSWNESISMIWEFKYIMNGMAVQDQSIKSDGSHSGSIRQFNIDSSRWYVHWYSTKSPSTSLPVWEGTKVDDKIILYKDQKAPNGTEGYYRLTFYDMSETGYKWVGEWVNEDETIIYPTWKIECIKKDK